jgi:hypothetical protein
METDFLYCIQCTDKLSGKIGSFLYHKDTPFEAWTEVFPDLLTLSLWLRAHHLAMSPEPDYKIIRVSA